MSRRRLVRRIVFLTLTAVVLTHELWFSWDGDPDSEPWTDLIVTYVPAEVALAVIAALVGWVPYHFFVRYRRRRKTSPPPG